MKLFGYSIKLEFRSPIVVKEFVKNDFKSRIYQLLDSANMGKLNAVKYIKEVTGMGLRDAKNYLDNEIYPEYESKKFKKLLKEVFNDLDKDYKLQALKKIKNFYCDWTLGETKKYFENVIYPEYIKYKEEKKRNKFIRFFSHFHVEAIS